MLEKRKEFFLGSGETFQFRMWSALSSSCMEGLSQNGMAPLPTSAAEFLTAYRFDSPRDEENTGTGFSSLILSALSGNVTVVRELIENHGANVNARVLIDGAGQDFGLEKGMDALSVACALCPQQQAHAIIQALIEAGANPNTTFASGGTPLIAAVVGQREESVRWLLACARGRLELELGLKINNATALNLAGFLSTFAILEALIHAGADVKHR